MKLELIHKWTCPYSARVRDFIEEKGLKDHIDFFEIIEDDGAKDRLTQLTGKSQVPCLVIDGEPKLESNDIIQWLAENGAKLDVKDEVGRDAIAWAHGVFLATHPPVDRPETVALIESLMAQQGTSTTASNP